MTRVHVITPVPLLSHLFNLSLIPFSFTFLHLTMPSFSFLSHLPSFPPHRPPSSSRLWSSYHLCPFITHILLLPSSSSSRLDHLPLVLGQFSLVLHSCNFHSVFSFISSCALLPQSHVLLSALFIIVLFLLSIHTPPVFLISLGLYGYCTLHPLSTIPSLPCHPFEISKYFTLTHPMLLSSFLLPSFLPLTINPPLHSSISRSRTPCS